MGLEEGETVVEIEYDHTGLLIRTNFNLFLLRPDSAGISKEVIDLADANVLLEEVEKIRLRHVSVLYLRNGRVLLYSTKRYCGTT